HIQIARREFHGEGKRTWRRRKTSRFREADAWEASIRDGAFVIILRNGVTRKGKAEAKSEPGSTSRDRGSGLFPRARLPSRVDGGVRGRRFHCFGFPRM
ncbi:MAG: hypothetical protein KKB90_08030, partial [Actinobacteria bacterium]|nr:hypothetical protein [Actinomycetota bacterium]MBU4218893.1 hypothetical protein [Actinomycetota bacterium]MBU4360175.1 hypothetical protein [Actinomycetota bacterium]MBU4443261.1 hypothetical protein [Actinomycetota bacterium]